MISVFLSQADNSIWCYQDNSPCTVLESYPVLLNNHCAFAEPLDRCQTYKPPLW